METGEQPKKARPAPPTTGQWKPGQSGNPAGRPKTKPFKDALAAILEKPELLEKVAAALTAKAITGDVSAIKEIADRMDGKIPQAIGGSDELGPIKTAYTWLPTDDDASSGTT